MMYRVEIVYRQTKEFWLEAFHTLAEKMLAFRSTT